MSFFKKIRFSFRLSSAFIKKRARLILVGFILGIIFYLCFPSVVKIAPRFQLTSKIGLVGKYTLQDIPDEILNKISVGLTKVLPDGEIKPNLCSRWEVSADGKIYTFYFDKEVFWHDGSKFKPDDITFNFKDAKIIPVDFRTLKIVLNEPYSPFLSVVSQPLFKKGLIGLGDYKVAKIERSGIFLKKILLIPSKNGSNLPNLLYSFYVNARYLTTAFKLGEVNIIEEAEDLGELKDWKKLKISSFQHNLRQTILFFNNSKDPFSEKNFRQAIAYAITKREGKERSLGPISSISWAFNPGIKKYEKDLEKTKLLLSKIKIYKDKIFLLHTFPSLETEANLIKNQLNEVGIKCDLRISSYLPDDFEILLVVREIPSDPDQYLQWHTGQKLNIGNFSNPRVDKLLEDGRKTLDQEERRKIYLDFQRFMVEESPAVFLYHPTYYRLER